MSSYTLKVEADSALKRIDIYLTEQLRDLPSRTFVQKLIESGCVTVNEVIVKSKYKIVEGDEVFVDVPENFLPPANLPAENIPLDVVYEDKYLIVINKPIGMLVHPASGIYTGTLVNALLYHCEQLSDINTEVRPGIVHRLDRETSGLIVAAKDNKTHAILAKQFEKHKIKKVYLALVEGYVEFDEGVVDAPIGKHPRQLDKKSVQFTEEAKEAYTQYKVIKRHNNMTLIALYPRTGRTHQLRVHMAHLRHPILGDEKYGEKRTFSRLALHAQKLGFTHPESKKFVEFSSSPPDEFLKAVDLKAVGVL